MLSISSKMLLGGSRQFSLVHAFVPNSSRQNLSRNISNAAAASSSSSSSSLAFRIRYTPSILAPASRNYNHVFNYQQNQRKTVTTKTKTSMYVKSTDDNFEDLDAFIQEATSTNDFFASSTQFPTFESIGIQNPILLERVHSILEQQSSSPSSVPKPSAIQAASYKAIQSKKDVTVGAETGSGKTLAYLLPIIDDILQTKLKKVQKQQTENQQEDDFYDDYGDYINGMGYDYARAVILVPNKELANQVIQMATPLCGGDKCIVWGTNGERQTSAVFGSPLPSTAPLSTSTNYDEMVRIGFLPGELNSPDDYKPFRLSKTDPKNNPPLDLLVCTPASLGPWGLNPKFIDVFADIKTIIIDEADMLFDGGYLRQLENTLLGFKRADRLDASFGVGKTQHVLVAATLPSMGTKSVDAYVQRKFPYATRVTMKGMHNARHYGLGEKTIWVEDDYDEMTPKKKRMERLVEMLQTSSSEGDDDDGNIALANEKVMVFLNNVNDVDSATNALRRSGIDAVPFHAKLPLSARSENLNRFRQFVAGQEASDDIDDDNVGLKPVPVLVCTDLAARGLDISEVTAVVQLKFAGNVVTHLHRMGRCGRAGNRDGRGVIFYGGVESELVEVVRAAEQQQETMILTGNEIEANNVEDGIEVKNNESGKVEAAFSRKRGFTRKRKKLKREAARGRDQEDGGSYY